MKQVRYLAGTAASAAVAGTTTAKTVSLEHTGMTTASGCTGSTEFTFHKGHIRGHGWYKKNGNQTCIGTVEMSLYFAKSFCKEGGFSMTGHTAGSYRTSSMYCGAKGFWVPLIYGVHKWFGGPVVSCQAWSTYQDNSLNMPIWKVP